MTSRRFDSAPRAIARLQRRLDDLWKQASRKGHGHDASHNAAHSALRAERITTSQTVNHNTGTTVVYNSLIREDDPDGDFSMSAGVLTVNNAGWYQFNAGVVTDADPNTTRYLLAIQQNGASVTSIDLSSAGNDRALTVGTTIFCAAADTVDVVFFHQQSDAGTLDILAAPRTFFSVFKVRE